MSLLAFAFTLLIHTIDKPLCSSKMPEQLPFLFQTIDAAQDIQSTLAGALLTMTTVSFSTIMVVLTLYSAQVSPRTLQNFLQSRVIPSLDHHHLGRKMEELANATRHPGGNPFETAVKTGHDAD